MGIRTIIDLRGTAEIKPKSPILLDNEFATITMKPSRDPFTKPRIVKTSPPKNPNPHSRTSLPDAAGIPPSGRHSPEYHLKIQFHHNFCSHFFFFFPNRSSRTGASSSSSFRSSREDFSRIRYHLDFSGRSILLMANWFVRVWGILLYLLGWKRYAARYFVSQTMNQVGLRGLYFNFVDNCQGGIRDALRIIADHNNHPVLVHCTQGKDRTGLVIALTLHIVGVPMEVILGDYRVSREGLTWEIPEMLREMEEVGLNPEFLDSPPETLRDTLGYIAERYSSIDGFLDRIGIREEERKRMRDGLLDLTQSPVSL